MSFAPLPHSLRVLQTSVPQASRSLCSNLRLYCVESHQFCIYLRFYGCCSGRPLLRFIAEWFGPSWIILHEQTQLQLYESRSPVSRQKLLSPIIALLQVINGAVYQEIICIWFDSYCGYKSAVKLWKGNCVCLSYPQEFSLNIIFHVLSLYGHETKITACFVTRLWFNEINICTACFLVSHSTVFLYSWAALDQCFQCLKAARFTLNTAQCSPFCMFCTFGSIQMWI